MAEETTQTQKGFIYYYSNADSVNEEMHHLAIVLPFEIPAADLPWKWHTEKPSEDLVDPVWDDSTEGWVENSKDNQGAILAQQQEQIENLIKTNKELQDDNDTKNKQIDALQNAIQQSVSSNNSLSAQFNQFGAQMTSAITQITTAVNKLTEDKGNETAPNGQSAQPQEGGNE